MGEGPFCGTEPLSCEVGADFRPRIRIGLTCGHPAGVAGRPHICCQQWARLFLPPRLQPLPLPFRGGCGDQGPQQVSEDRYWTGKRGQRPTVRQGWNGDIDSTVVTREMRETYF